jgi:hypothetical protein
MATIAIQTVAGANTYTRQKNLSNTDANRLLAWAKGAFGAGLTDAQAHSAMADYVFAYLKSSVLDYERVQAAITAQAAVTDIAIT